MQSYFRQSPGKCESGYKFERLEKEKNVNALPRKSMMATIE